MGLWHPVAGSHVEESWRPAHHGDWPHPEPSSQHDIIPAPCDRCGGEVIRRVTLLNAGDVARTAYYNAKESKLAAAEHRAPVLLDEPAEHYGYLYELRHYRSRCIGGHHAASVDELARIRPLRKVAD